MSRAASVEKKTQRIEEEKKALEKARAEKKELIKKRREEWKAKGKKYHEELIKEEQHLIEAKREARNSGNFYMAPEAKVAFVIRIKGVNHIRPQVKKILRLLRLRQLNNGVFVKINKATMNMIKRIEPYVAYGYPNRKTISDLIYKRGFAKINHARQDVSKAKWTAELYDKDNVGVKNLDQTKYVATPAADGKVVTVTLSGKALDFGETYYLSLKATKGEGDDVVVLYDSSAAKVKTDTTVSPATTTLDNDNSYGCIPNSTTVRLNTKIMELKNSNKPYIKVQVKSEDEIAGLDNLYVVEASNNKASETTSFDEFKKSNTGKIELEFSVDISAVTDKDHVYLANDVYDWASEENVVKANTYVLDTDKTSVAGNKITLKAKYAFKSGSKVVPTVFNKTTGKRIELKTVEDKPYFVKDDVSTSSVDEYKGYTSLKFAQPTELSKVLDSTVTATKELGLTLVDSEKKIANGQDIKLKFTPVYAETKTTTDYGTYTLYRKKTVVPASASTWEKVGTKSYVVKPSDSTFESLQYLKVTTTGTGSAAKTEYSGVNAEVGDFAVRGKSAVIIIKALADEFDYAKTSEYKLVCEIDGAEIYSEAVKVTDNTVVLASDNKTLSGVTMPTAVTESPLTGENDAGTITVATTAYLSDKNAPVYVNVKLGEGVTATSLTNKHISKLTTNKPVVKVGDDGKSVVITIGKDVSACLGDTITIDVYDVHEQKGTIEVVLK